MTSAFGVQHHPAVPAPVAKSAIDRDDPAMRAPLRGNPALRAPVDTAGIQTKLRASLRPLARRANLARKVR